MEYYILQIVFILDGETCKFTNGTVSRTCQDGCCSVDTCCDAPFWTWGRVIGVVVAVIVGIILIVLLVMLCIYCKKKKTLAGRLHHTVSMRSQNIIYPMMHHPHLPPDYDEPQSNPSGGPGPPVYDDRPPPAYEAVVPPGHRQPKISQIEPGIANNYRTNR
ncbi:uncharacterized protein LOC128222551 isoform X2 [Mya arenaria]|uniref:uncharacterized protein LOC128222551 isoform X2 n=1 Tax=Mya arenaria TaxID=6604 RepID=UPI0022E35D78|nr:uncharacterized protein LOC128222551 isoform X2 [Mya arenaria]